VSEPRRTEGGRVWVTRAEPGATATAGRLRDLGFEPVVAPLIVIEPVGEGPIDLTGVGALAFTSANGVAAFAARSVERVLPVFAVGAATAQVARQAGFRGVSSADGDVDALAPLVAARGPYPGVVLHPGAAEGAGDLTGALTGLGVPARRLVVYRSVDVSPGDATAAQVRDLTAVLLHSPRAGRGLARWLRANPAPDLVALCLSAQVALPLADLPLAAVRVAAAPTEDAVLALLGRVGQAS
jgi:uroporphyrinogen-III synthase